MTCYDRIKALYECGRLTEAGVWKAVRLGLITEEEAHEILGK